MCAPCAAERHFGQDHERGVARRRRSRRPVRVRSAQPNGLELTLPLFLLRFGADLRISYTPKEDLWRSAILVQAPPPMLCDFPLRTMALRPRRSRSSRPRSSSSPKFLPKFLSKAVHVVLFTNGLRAVSAALLAANVMGQQEIAHGQEPLGSKPCGEVQCRGRRVPQGLFGTAVFCIPGGMKIRNWSSFEGDFGATVTVQRRGVRAELVFYTHGSASGPHAKIGPLWDLPDHMQVTVDSWTCSGKNNRDYRASSNGRNWRMLTFLSGTAEYKDVPRSLAVELDGVLDSLCCVAPPP
jgi:hypothetical protein